MKLVQTNAKGGKFMSIGHRQGALVCKAEDVEVGNFQDDGPRVGVCFASTNLELEVEQGASTT